MNKPESSTKPLEELTQLSFGYTLSSEKMEIRLSVNGKEEKLENSLWDNDSLIIADHPYIEFLEAENERLRVNVKGIDVDTHNMLIADYENRIKQLEARIKELEK